MTALRLLLYLGRVHVHMCAYRGWHRNACGESRSSLIQRRTHKTLRRLNGTDLSFNHSSASFLPST